MHISEAHIRNYRNFEDNIFEFNEGLNVIIGHNNSGKTNLIKALQLVLDNSYRDKPSVDDFCKKNKDYSTPPSIEISIIIKEDDNDQPDDKVVVYDWLTSESPKYEAELTYIYELPVRHHEEYSALIEEHKKPEGTYDQEECLRLIRKKFINKYVGRVYGGNPEKRERADSDNLNRFDFQFLDAIRDAERQMFFGNNTILRDVLNFFLDYDMTEGKSIENLEGGNKEELKRREEEFSAKSHKLLDILIKRIDRDKILQYSQDTGADKGGVPDFDADVIEEDLLFALRLIVQKNGFQLPIRNNGLGYNNLLYMALVLARMQMKASDTMGDNATVFPVLVIEEPEAHLHPSMQSKFLSFLNNNRDKTRQIFISTHSTHITSAVNLDSIICLYEDIKGDFRVGYPGKVFNKVDQEGKEDQEDLASKSYVERFLDATKSNMLFANKVIFVEGIAEQILLPCFAEYLGLEHDLESEHVAIVSVDSRTFKHFLKLFDYKEGANPYAINKKIVCITDADPTKKIDNRWKAAFPYELDSSDTENFKALSKHVKDLKSDFETKNNNIYIFYPEEGKGKTLEYELCRENPKSELLITELFPKNNSAHTIENYKSVISKYDESFENLLGHYLSLLGSDNTDNNPDLKALSSCSWGENDKKSALMATIYYKTVSKAKGAHAFYLEKNLRDNFAKNSEEREDFSVPTYIKNAIEEILKSDS